MPQPKGPDRFVLSRAREAAAHLSPGLFPAGRQAEWAEQNRTITVAVHPLNNKLAVAVEGKLPRESLAADVRIYDQDKRVHICENLSVPDERIPFINDTHAVFLTLQSIMQASVAEDEAERVPVGIDSLIRMSSLYREAMLRQMKVLQEAKQQSEFVQTEVDVFQSMHAVWHLLEIIYLTTNTYGLNSSIVPHFMEWLNVNFPSPLAEEADAIAGASADALAQSDDLWPYLNKLVLRGHVSILANILGSVAASRHLSPSAARWSQEIADLAREMPLASDEETAGSFNARWRRWNERLQNASTAMASLIPEDSDASFEDPALASLYNIAEVLRGNVDVIYDEGKTWQDILGATLLYNEPTAQADRLPSLADVVVQQFRSSEFPVLDRALVALLNHDLPSFAVYCNQIDPWLSAHIVDLMDHISILESCHKVFAVDPREHYLLALGESYLGHESLWRVGLDYLGMSSEAGICVMEEYAMRIPLESDRKAQQVLRVCEKYQLRRATDRIHRQLGRQKWQRGRLGAAIGHFAQVADRNSIGKICDQLWDQYLETGRLTYGPIIDGVIASGLKHDRLQFLMRYRDFHECYKAGAFVEAGKILLSILLNEIAPQYAIADLLVDAIPLLEGDALVFGPDDTFELMRCAETLLQSPFPISGTKSSSGTVEKSELSIFHVACARNLARSFVSF
ncbi:hypothetical protein GGI12_004001 [Dipsacomyces acuminosporus]|nr:hypothetical protein GGI12_004001 [Dipsacomyces acuminosporus]